MKIEARRREVKAFPRNIILPNRLYSCWLLVALQDFKDFKDHSSGREFKKWGVVGNSFTEFIHQYWMLSKEFLSQEILFRCGESGTARPVSNEEDPKEPEFCRLSLFNEKTNHKYHPIDKITPNLLQNWRKNEIYLLLHVYSLSINNSVFKCVRRSW